MRGLLVLLVALTEASSLTTMESKMSAWFVGEDHVNAMLTWIAGYRYGVRMPNGSVQSNPTDEQLTEIGKVLLSENIASLRARYPKDWQELVDLDVNTYRFREDCAFLRKTPNLAVTVIKLVDCYEYQSCEHDGWGESWARRFCQFLIGAATSQLPGYDEAPWGYERQEKPWSNRKAS